LVKPGTHVNAIGSYTPDRRELDEELLLSAGKVVVDSREAVLSEAGDLIIPMVKGLFSADIIKAEVGEILLGQRPGRESPEEITVYKAVGIGALDLVSAQAAYRRATELGLGTQVAGF
jgi:ornithine cyclodeaminase/alanine dehydrogenase-like protein (mu-crystallin family)